MRIWVGVATRSRSALLVLFVAGTLAACEEPPQEPPVRPLRTLVIGDAAGWREDSFPGRAKATQEVDLAFEVQGQLQERPVKVGDSVQKGQVLGRLDARDYANALAAARARRDRAKAELDRVAVAARTGAVSRQDLTDAQARFDQHEAEVAIRRKALEDSVLIAPFDGVVSHTYVDNFQNVRAKQPVIRLLDVSQIEMEVAIPESLIGLAPYVEEVEVRFDARADVAVPAAIKEIGNEASKATRTYPVTLVMDPPQQFELKPGMAGVASGRARVPGDAAAEGFEIPLSAVFSPPGEPSQKSFVWLVDSETSTVRRAQVETLGLRPRGVLVRGLSPGDRIATAGVHYLREGQQVRVLD